MIGKLLLQFYFPRVLRKVCPETIPLCGKDAESVDCFYVHQLKGDDPYLVFLAVDGEDVKALEFDGKRYSIERILPRSQLDPKTITFTHYNRWNSITYEGVWDLALGQTFRIPYLIAGLRSALNAIDQRFFNLRPLVVRERLEILGEVLAMAQKGMESVDAMTLMSERYGHRWAGHPDWQKHEKLIDFYLNGLVETGDLKREGFLYRPSGNAIKTLEDANEQDRRHRANLRVQMLLAFLTFVSAVGTAVQANLIKLP